MLWRRLLGGFLGYKRSLIMLSSIFWLLPIFLLDYKIGIASWLISMLYFSFGHQWAKGINLLLLRYALPSIALGFIASAFGYLLPLTSISGILIAIVYYICAKDPENCTKHGLFKKGKEEFYFIDGKIAYAELFAGFIWFNLITLDIFLCNSF